MDPANKPELDKFTEAHYTKIMDRFEAGYEDLLYSEEEDDNPNGYWPQDFQRAFERKDICNWNFKKTLTPYFRRWKSEDFKTGRFGSIIADIGKETSLESKSSRSRSRSRSRERKTQRNNKVCLVVQYFLFSINRGLLFYFILFYLHLLFYLFYLILFYLLLLFSLFYFILFYSVKHSDLGDTTVTAHGTGSLSVQLSLSDPGTACA